MGNTGVIGSFSAMFVHRSASLQLFLVVWIFMRSLGIICYDSRVLSQGHKNYFNNYCIMKSQPTFLISTYSAEIGGCC